MVEERNARHRLDFVRRLKQDRLADSVEMNPINDLISGLPPKAKDYLSFLTLNFLEKDVFESTFANTEAVDAIRRNFNEFGVDSNQADTLLDFLRKDREKKE